MTLLRWLNIKKLQTQTGNLRKFANALYTVGKTEEAFENLTHSIKFDLGRNFKKYSNLYFLFAGDLFLKLK